MVEKVGEELIAGQKGFKTTSLRIPQDLFDEAEMLAEAQGLNMTEYIRDAMAFYAPVAARDPRALKMAKRRAREAVDFVKKLEKLGQNGTSGEEEDEEDEE